MQVDINGDQTFKIQEAAEILRLSEDETLDLVHRGELPASNINTKPNAQRPRWRILGSDIGKFLFRTRFKPESKPKQRRCKRG